MYCNYCGKVIQDDANHCAYCGIRVGAVEARLDRDAGRACHAASATRQRGDELVGFAGHIL